MIYEVRNVQAMAIKDCGQLTRVSCRYQNFGTEISICNATGQYWMKNLSPKIVHPILVTN